jgi:hypothetical protein
MAILHEDICTFMISSLILPRIRNVSDQSGRENKTRFPYNNFFFSENRRPQMTIRRMRFACWVPKFIKTLSECVIRTAFPLQRWFYERASMLPCTYIVCLVER